MRTGLSQQKFADVLGVSTRTLQGWEQGRRKPSGAARSLLVIAKRRPEVLRELFAGWEPRWFDFRVIGLSREFS